MSIAGLIIQIVSGAVRGNVVGAAMNKFSLGNSIAGIGGQLASTVTNTTTRNAWRLNQVIGLIKSQVGKA